MIPQLLLEEILVGEKDARNYYSKYGKEELENALLDLQKSNQEILDSYPVDKMQDMFMEKAIRAENKSKANSSSASDSEAGKEDRPNKKFRLLRWTYAAAAVFAIFLSIPLVFNTLRSRGEASGTRLKGHNSGMQQMHLYKASQNSAIRLKDGDLAWENDKIQIAYLPGNKSYGVIFSVDGSGNISRHFPEDSWKAARLENTGEEVPLSYSYVLDDAPKYECFVFVASKEPFDMEEIVKSNKKLYSIEYLKKGKYLPAGCSSSVFVLKKK